MNITLTNILVAHRNGWDLTADQLAYIAEHSEHVTLEDTAWYVERRTQVGNYSDCGRFTGI